TRCSLRAPFSTQLLAMAAGSSPNVVARSMSPCCRRTQWPSFRSIAGMRSMVGNVKAVGGMAQQRWRPLVSGRPLQEVAVESEALVGAFFRMELRSKNIIACNHSSKAGAVIRLSDAVARIRRSGIEAVDEIEVAAIRNTVPH